MVRRASIAVVATLTMALVACSEHASVAAYFEEAQDIAERMVEMSTKFETVINAQEDPMQWSDESKQQLSATLDGLRELRDEANGMSVPEAFTYVHPLLVQSLDRMIEAIEIIDEIAVNPAIATVDLANDMTQKAEEGERLANEYVTGLERVLQEKYPELLEE